MSSVMYKNSRKEDIVTLLHELGEPVDSENETIVQLKTKVENSQSYKDNAAMVADLLASIVEERKMKVQRETQQLEVERVKLAQLETELEIQKLKQNSKPNELLNIPTESVTNMNNLEHLIKSVRTLTIPIPEKSENLNLFFQSLERAFLIKKVPEELKSEILINLLAEKLSNILSYVCDEDLKSYDKMKDLVLREHQPTALECLIKFRKAVREPNETHILFCSRIYALFRYYLKLRNVNDFETLCDLIIHDKFFQTLDKDTTNYMNLKENDSWMKPNDLAKECDIYFVNRGRPFSELRSFAREKAIDSNKILPSARFSKMQTPFKNNKEKKVSCFICSGSHYAKSCPKRHPNSQSEIKKEVNLCENVNTDSISSVQSLNIPSDLLFNDLQYVKILLDEMLCYALIDSGSSSVVVNKQIINHPKETIGQTILSSCFNERKNASLAKFKLSLPNKHPIYVTGAICENLSCDVIIPTNVFEILEQQNNQPSSDTQTPISDGTELNLKDKQHCFSSFVNEKNIEENKISLLSCHNKSNKFNEKQNDFSFPSNENNSFLLKMCNAVETKEYDLSHLSDIKLRNKVNELINNYKPTKTENADLKMSIILTDDIPVCVRPRRLSIIEKEEVQRQIDEWLRDGIIRESYSNYCSPIVVCRKKNGELRLCVDYRQLNKKTIKDKYPLPIIEEVFDKLGNAKIFTTLDLKNAFFHVEIDEQSRKYTAFATENQFFEFLKVPFGLCNSPLVFQRYVNHVFKDLLRDGTVVIYLDDIIIPARDEQEGLEKLMRVLKTASKFGLELNLKKCQFMKRKIDFLGHIIENGTIKPSFEKTAAVQNFPEPRNVKEVQSFLGLTSYFRKYIPSYATIARPLSDLLRASSQFRFEQEQKLSFQMLKDILCSEPVLHLYKQRAKLELHTDASKLGFGAILLQEGDDGNLHPIHYMSRKTSKQEENYCSYELEVLAIVEALKKFRNYLLGTKFKIYTDCAAFTKTLSKKDLTPKVARWTLFLQEFNYEVVHRPGKLMQHVDALSRHPIMMITTDEITCKIANSQNNDEHIKTIKELLGKSNDENYLIKNGVLYRYDAGRELLVVPEGMHTEIINKVHQKGHFASAKTEEMLKRDFFIPGLRKKVDRVISNCVKCILCNRKAGKKEGYLNPIPKEDTPLSTYHADFIGPLPSTNKKYQHIFTVVDAFTKFTWLYPVKTVSAEDALEKLKLQQKTFGNPSRIITDRGSAFTSKAFSDYCTEEGIQHLQIATGVPRGNGQVERIHGIIIPVLSKLSLDDATKWYKHVDKLQRILNSTVSRSTKVTPFRLLTGVEMKNKEDIRIRDTLEEELKRSFMENREMLRREAKQQILKIQQENKRHHDKKCKAATKYHAGDLVAIQRTQFGTGMKLRPKYLGPYEVTRVKRNDRYDVEKVGDHDGPNNTSTSADHMKPWC